MQGLTKYSLVTGGIFGIATAALGVKWVRARARRIRCEAEPVSTFSLFPCVGPSLDDEIDKFMFTLAALTSATMLTTAAVTAASSPRRSLGGARMAKVDTPSYGLGRTTRSCRPAKVGHRVQLCLTKPDQPGPVVSGPAAACALLASTASADRESFQAVLLDIRNRVIGIDEVAKGTLTSVEVHPRELFKSAIAGSAAGIIVSHNHPSGDPEPSPEDKELTARLISIGKLVGVPVLDHVIVATSGCTSLRETTSLWGTS